jgi:exopolysaccharide biosynthesis polyprenyl glycosylphosphotransferase
LRSMRMLRYRGVAILDYISLHERLAGEIPVDLIDDAWLLRAATSSSRLHLRRLKRLIDLAFSALLLLPVVLLVLPAVALAIRLDSPGPILYRQERLGVGGRRFMVLKLRTMRVDAEQSSGPAWSADHDPRVTRVGRMLRKFRLDELPQVFNVLRGEMSLVGPRPERPALSSRIQEAVPLFSERLCVRPGITGWAQVMAPYAASVGDSYRKLQFDLYYTKNLSPLLDAVILFKTVKTVLLGRERSRREIRVVRTLQAGAAASAGTAVQPERLGRLG